MSDSDDQNPGQPGPTPEPGGGQPPPYGQPNPYGQPPQYGGYQPYGAYGRPLNMPARPSTHLAGAIITTLLCCLPAGVVAIVFASRVDSLYRQGDYEGALRASTTAQLWIYLSIGLSLIWIILVLAFVLGGTDSTTFSG